MTNGRPIKYLATAKTGRVVNVSRIISDSAIQIVVLYHTVPSTLLKGTLDGQ